MEQSKKCSKCKIEKLSSDYNKDSTKKDNFQSCCRICNKSMNSIWEKNNRSHRNKYKRKKYVNDVSFRLACNLRFRLRTALLKQVAQKNSKTEKLLGISFEEFKEYIEFLMTSDMTFNNIHLDHVQCLKSFDSTNPNQLKEAAHYSNIQPLFKTK